MCLDERNENKTISLFDCCLEIRLHFKLNANGKLNVESDTREKLGKIENGSVFLVQRCVRFLPHTVETQSFRFLPSDAGDSLSVS